MIAEQQGRGTGATASAVENDIIGAGFKGKIDVALDMVGGQFKTYGIPLLNSRTFSAKSRKSLALDISRNVGGDTAAVPSGN